MKKLSMEELGRMNVEAFKQSEKLPIVVVLDNIRSMNNIGSVFRTCDAFRIEEIILCGITACPPHKDIEKTALGATESVKWSYSKNTLEAIETLKVKNYIIYSVEQVEHSLSLEAASWDGRQAIALIFGNEVMGVDQEVVNKSDHCIEIPQFGTKHSLNISVSAGIVLWHFCYLSLKNK
ncbi:MAG: RNA methyltransferase [Bacteroidales bacterium]|nr:RNA methyltransferase [Bacteroidales bacterium]